MAGEYMKRFNDIELCKNIFVTEADARHMLMSRHNQ